MFMDLLQLQQNLVHTEDTILGQKNFIRRMASAIIPSMMAQ
jgi:hypothetical protein